MQPNKNHVLAFALGALCGALLGAAAGVVVANQLPDLREWAPGLAESVIDQQTREDTDEE